MKLYVGSDLHGKSNLIGIIDGEGKRVYKKKGNYASYCRKVRSRWLTNGKVKGRGNSKNGNRYLAWAFSEAAEFARRYDEDARAYYNRKKQKTNFMVAHNALAHKLARAAYYVMRDQVPFNSAKLFG